MEKERSSIVLFGWIGSRKMRFVAQHMLLGFLLALCLMAQASLSPREQLQQYVLDLQKNPSDDGLRERIIKLALSMNPKPALPAGALEREGAAEFAFKNAKSGDDYRKAADQYQQALNVAPWVAADYYNLGVSREKADDPKSAATAFQFYLLAAPHAEDHDDVIKRIGGLKYASQEKENTKESPATGQEKRKTGVEALAGRWHGTAQWAGRGRSSQSMSIDLVGVIQGRDIFFLPTLKVFGNLHGRIEGDRLEDIQWETGYFAWPPPDWTRAVCSCTYFPGLAPRPVSVAISDSMTRLRYRLPMYSANDDNTYRFLDDVWYSFDLTKERD